MRCVARVLASGLLIGALVPAGKTVAQEEGSMPEIVQLRARIKQLETENEQLRQQLKLAGAPVPSEASPAAATYSLVERDAAWWSSAPKLSKQVKLRAGLQAYDPKAAFSAWFGRNDYFAGQKVVWAIGSLTKKVCTVRGAELEYHRHKVESGTERSTGGPQDWKQSHIRCEECRAQMMKSLQERGGGAVISGVCDAVSVELAVPQADIERVLSVISKSKCVIVEGAILTSTWTGERLHFIIEGRISEIPPITKPLPRPD